MSDKPAWMSVAEKEVGVEEPNQRILDYFKDTTDDEATVRTAYCSAFVNFCFEKAGIKGTMSAAAVSWRQWGQELKTGQLGAVVLLRWRSGHYHVTFYLEEAIRDGVAKIHVLGGNQTTAHEVIDEWVPKANVVTYRWPPNVPV